MFVLLSPAKKLDLSPPPSGLAYTQPLFPADTGRLARKARTLSKRKIGNLMGISEALSELSYERFQRLEDALSPANAKQAALTFAGDTYVGLDVSQLTADDLNWAQERVGILSGLYGLLRPLDLMQPYRLEMGTRLPIGNKKNLYEFWGDKLAQQINDLTEGHEDPTVVNCASNEYFKAASAPAMEASVVTPVFRDVKNGKSRTLFLFAKRARGSMARWIIQQRIEEVEQLKGFTEGGYRFQPKLSDRSTFVFERPQPPPVGR